MDEQSYMKELSEANLNFAALGNRIRSARRKSGLTQAELARRLEVTASAVAQWESPHGTRPSLTHVVRIASITGASVDWLATAGSSSRGGLRQMASGNAGAVRSETFAMSDVEEIVLSAMRVMPPRCRELVAALARELAHRKAPGAHKRR